MLLLLHIISIYKMLVMFLKVIKKFHYLINLKKLNLYKDFINFLVKVLLVKNLNLKMIIIIILLVYFKWMIKV